MFDFKDLIQGINLAQLLAMDDKIQRATLRVGDTVPASSALPTTLNISNRGVFLCLSITGRFSTLDTGPADTGGCKLSMAIKNGSGRVYIPDLIHLDSLFTPGRVKDSLDTTGAAGNQLQFEGLEWVTVFRPTDILTHTVQNDAAYANSWEMAYHGLWIKS